MNKPLKVMLVDDQKMANFINKKLIEVTDFAHNIVDYTLPEAALLDVEAQKPDIIFLDLNMPIIDGWTFLDNLQENKNSTQVVIVTSSTSSIDKEKAQNYTQVVDFLIKPLNRNTILSLKNKLKTAS
ncbi:CheY-like chemotaxis protein [Leeuwenhoekiella aestuarii]|uniref:CheY-like chemotaxis protein n=1 Tax=Leeuwenhoekiella aestuarii TaxID=2249426 RepID=A0A4Q0P1G8_9FLAO|nr:response regulator [Leeuwenhoekiella aestuarii]RXG18486.1 CheY-like chemotaxis protein [Leeuwenhoekiella aestuarii]RXG19791.1 CheY-like chemotaxis protein [Leeuwenhoekiella aestuarii]